MIKVLRCMIENKEYEIYISNGRYCVLSYHSRLEDSDDFGSLHEAIDYLLRLSSNNYITRRVVRRDLYYTVIVTGNYKHFELRFSSCDEAYLFLLNEISCRLIVFDEYMD